jgi:fido (protein-threonine AMPylation protein)
LAQYGRGYWKSTTQIQMQMNHMQAPMKKNEALSGIESTRMKRRPQKV